MTDLAPCPRCREREKLVPELHPGTAFVRCGACNYMGPEFLPRGDGKQVLPAVIRAWNTLPR
ncbi:Lar family restriction alleviation protein [Noviherbaspirillum album]|uniref:Lar family restriction alleviation protein n=1 Tax=Noviherbaspirillum album TaxID=3080276 RepID=UPI00345F2BF4